MRISTLPLLACTCLLGLALWAVSAHAEGEGPGDSERLRARVDALESKVEKLHAEAELLRAREVATTKYLLGIEKTVQDFRGALAQARREGFEAAAISSTSRVALLQGLEKFADDLGTGLPVATSSEQDGARRARR